MAVLLVTTSGCAAREFAIPAPDARRAPTPPTFVTPPSDPGDDPQLAALTLPEDRAGAGSESSLTNRARGQFASLDALLVALRAKLGDDLSISRVDVDYSGTTVTLRTSAGEDEYREYDGVLRRRPLQGAPAGGPTKAFRLGDLDVDAIARLVQGIGRRLPQATADITLSDPEPGDLAWRIRLQRGGVSALVVAAPDGSIRRVET